MSPTQQDQQMPNPQDLPASPQDLPVVVNPIDPSSIVPTEAVEVKKDMYPEENDGSVELPALEVPEEPDYDVIKITRPDRPESEKRGISRGRRIAAALTGAAVLAAGGVGAKLASGESTPVNSTNTNTEQLQEEGVETVASTIAVDRPNQSSLSGVGEVDSVTNAPEDQNGSNDLSGSNSQPELLSHTNNGVLPLAHANSANSVGTPGTNSEVEPSVPANIEKNVVGPEDYPGEITVNRSVDFATYLMNNQQKTGLSPTIEVSDSESGILTFSDPNGYVFIVSGRMADGNIIVDDKMPMRGIGAITIIDTKGNQITVKSSKDLNVKPATNVTKKGQNSITTDQDIFPGSTIDAQGVSDEGGQITAEVKDYFSRTFQI